MASLLDKQKAIMEHVSEGAFVKAVEEFYAEDAINEPGRGETIEGKERILEHERKVAELVADFRGCTVYAMGVGDDDGKGNGVTFAEYELRLDMEDGTTFNPKQVQVNRWEGGEVKRVSFYYDPTRL